MKRLAVLAFGTVMLATTAMATDMAEPAPLKQLCDRICGGTWKPESPPVPDQFATTYSYEWDAPLGLIRGKITTVGGVAGIHQETIVLFGIDEVKKTIWAFEGDGQGRPRYGTVEFIEKGYRETMDILGSDMGKLTFTFVFTGPDEFQVTAEMITPNGPVTSTTDVYQRVQP